MFWKCNDFEFDVRVPVIMGILNVTPDSFSDGGSYAGVEEALASARGMCDEGAAIIDVGGESTRPGAGEVSSEEELARVLPVVRQLADEGFCVSIDTRHAEVARACVEAGAAIINDVTGFTDPEMIAVARESNCGLVVMHNGVSAKADAAGEPFDVSAGVQAAATLEYDDVVDETRDWLGKKAAELEAAGIEHRRICIDPGPGFGKNEKQTIELVRNFQEFRHLGYPVMCAVSRKRFIGYAYKIAEPKERDLASAAEALLACELGCGVVRVHNVAQTAAALKDLRPYAIIGMGSNVALVAEPGEEREAKEAQINLAIGEMCLLPDTTIVDVSSFYESEPAYYEDQDLFVNAALVLRTGLPPKELLDYLHIIENNLGRVREIENGPRTLDLDIVDYQMYLCDKPELMLPHPRETERDFVVKPVEEILPGHILADGTVLACVPEEERIGRAHRV